MDSSTEVTLQWI